MKNTTNKNDHQNQKPKTIKFCLVNGKKGDQETKTKGQLLPTTFRDQELPDLIAQGLPAGDCQRWIKLVRVFKNQLYPRSSCYSFYFFILCFWLGIIANCGKTHQNIFSATSQQRAPLKNGEGCQTPTGCLHTWRPSTSGGLSDQTETQIHSSMIYMSDKLHQISANCIR